MVLLSLALRSLQKVCLISRFALPATIPAKQDGCHCPILSTRTRCQTGAQVRASWASSPLRPCPAPTAPALLGARGHPCTPSNNCRILANVTEGKHDLAGT